MLNKNYNLLVNENYKLILHEARSTKKYLYPTLSRFEIKKSEKNNLFYWLLRANNANVILKSLSGLDCLQSCLDNIIPVLSYGLSVDNYEIEAQNINNGLFYLLFDNVGNKLAVSGNNNNYGLHNASSNYNIALVQQVSFTGATKGINSCINNISKIVNKDKKVLFYN